MREDGIISGLFGPLYDYGNQDTTNTTKSKVLTSGQTSRTGTLYFNLDPIVESKTFQMLAGLSVFQFFKDLWDRHVYFRQST